jgi:hypothetical protein
VNGQARHWLASRIRMSTDIAFLQRASRSATTWIAYEAWCHPLFEEPADERADGATF